jgi:hypothetical protein
MHYKFQCQDDRRWPALVVRDSESVPSELIARNAFFVSLQKSRGNSEPGIKSKTHEFEVVSNPCVVIFQLLAAMLLQVVLSATRRASPCAYDAIPVVVWLVLPHCVSASLFASCLVLKFESYLNSRFILCAGKIKTFAIDAVRSKRLNSNRSQYKVPVALKSEESGSSFSAAKNESNSLIAPCHFSKALVFLVITARLPCIDRSILQIRREFFAMMRHAHSETALMCRRS